MKKNTKVRIFAFAALLGLGAPAVASAELLIAADATRVSGGVSAD